MADQVVHHLLQLPILGHVGTAGHGDLDQLDGADVLRVFDQEKLVGLEPADEALGVVKPVYTKDNLSYICIIEKNGNIFNNKNTINFGTDKIFVHGGTNYKTESLT